MPDQTGIIHQIFAEVQVTPKFKKREFILRIPGSQTQYDEYVTFQLSKNMEEAIDVYQLGEHIKVYYNLKGREAKGKYYNTISAWRMERVNG